MNEPANVPKHIAIIMDGNGRWAAARGLPRIKGHEEGSKSVSRCLEACNEAGVRYLTLYAFSSENWRRPKSETDALMNLLEQFLKSKTKELLEKKIRLHAIGDLDRLPGSCRRTLQACLKKTGSFEEFHLILALSYSGRRELTHAARMIAQDVRDGRLNVEDITTETISANLYTAGIPDPDLLVRTSGEFRVSNFLLWQLSYTELYISDKLWPDFGKDDLLEAIRDYGKRQRRFGDIH